MSSSDSKHNTNDADSNDNSDNSDDDCSNGNGKDVLDEVLPVDVACQQHQQPTEGDI